MQCQWMWPSVREIFTLSRGDNDTVSVELLADGAADAECLGVIGVKDADSDDCAVSAEVPAKSARKRRRNACGVPPEQARADNCGDGLTLGVVLRELLKSHWSTSWTSSLGVGPPSSSPVSTQDSCLLTLHLLFTANSKIRRSYNYLLKRSSVSFLSYYSSNYQSIHHILCAVIFHLKKCYTTLTWQHYTVSQKMRLA